MRWLRHLLPAVLIGVVIVLTWEQIAGLDLHLLRDRIRDVPAPVLLMLQGLALFAVLAMALYDGIAQRWLGTTLTTRQLLRFSWIANSFNNFIGLSGLAGSGVRMLLLTREGIPAPRAGVFAGLILMAVPLGLSVLVLLALPDTLGGRLDPLVPRSMALAVLAAFFLYLPVFLLLSRSRQLLHRVLPDAPALGLRRGLVLAGVSVVDWLLAIGVAWACVTATGVSVEPAAFVTAFALAAALGILSLLPGGIGVFDGTLLYLLAGSGQASEAVLSGILLYRLSYFVVPWLIGVYLGLDLLKLGERSPLRRLSLQWQSSLLAALLRLPVRFLANLSVRLLGYLTLATGVVLLVSAATPAVESRVAALNAVLPLAALEASHALSVAVGVMLIAVSRGIADQVRDAYRLAMAMLFAGVLLSLLKGIDFEEATLLGLAALVLWLSRRSFYRLSYPLHSRRSLYWLLALLVGVGGYAALGHWIHEIDGIVDSGLWLAFDPQAHDSRFVRSLPVAVLAATGALAWSFFRMPRPPCAAPDSAALDKARRFLERHPVHGFAHLIFMRDKCLFYGADGAGLIQYARIRDRVVALGDPMGSPHAFRTCLSEFRQMADVHDLVPVFYEVGEHNLHHYHDVGFSLFKIGEMAMVRTADFSLAGRRGESLRHGVNRARRESVTVEILPQPLDDTLWDELRAISDRWLATRGSAEKGFSLGRWDRDYLASSPTVVARWNGRVVAFANLMPAYGGGELSVDLMRQVEDAPTGTMDLLFVTLIEHARAQGVPLFNLGMAPLSGVGQCRFARRQERLARFAFDYGSRLYNYKGLRTFKDKFNPIWEGRYIAYPVLTPLPPLLVDIAALIAGGYRRLLWPGDR
jgi:phosphatidylglycerol lysyltransferase